MSKHAVERAVERYGRSVSISEVEQKIKAGRAKREHQTRTGSWIYKVRTDEGMRVFPVYDGDRVRTFLTQEQVSQMKEVHRKFRVAKTTKWRKQR